MSAPPAARGTVAAAAARSEPARIDSSSADPPQTLADTEAIDQFELVLKTLGLSLDEDEPPLQPAGEKHSEPLHDTPESSSGPTRTIENIVLEGDGVSQSQAEVPDKPLDELEIFTRRMSQVTGAVQPASLDTHSAPPRTPSARLPSARAPLPSRRGSATRTPAPQAPRARASHGDLAFEEQALPDDSVLDDRALDEPLDSESDPAEPGEDAAAAADLYVPSFTEPSLPYRWAWIAGCVVLGLLLILQALHHWRNQLSSSAVWGAPVRRLYAAIGAPIAPHWDLSAYEVRQQGAEFEPGKRQTILVRFSLANHASRAQPVPLLRLTLLDRYGRRVAQRDLAPTDYWPPGHAPAAFLGSDKRVDTEVQVRDPSADSASFELDVCLRDLKGLIHCAGDANAAGSENGAL